MNQKLIMFYECNSGTSVFNGKKSTFLQFVFALCAAATFVMNTQLEEFSYTLFIINMGYLGQVFLISLVRYTRPDYKKYPYWVNTNDPELRYKQNLTLAYLLLIIYCDILIFGGILIGIVMFMLK